MILESLEVVIPEPLIMRDPVPHWAESFRDEMVAAFASVPLLRHETGIEQDAQVLGNRRPAHLEMSRNRVDGTIGLHEQIEHPAARGMSNSPKHIWFAIGRHHHAANICKKTLTCQVRSRPCHPGRTGLSSIPA